MKKFAIAFLIVFTLIDAAAYAYQFPQQGGSLGTWGTELRNYFGQMFDLNNGAAIKSYTKAGLPAAGTAGRLARVTDDIRGLWMDTGTKWVSVTGEANASDFGAKCDDSSDDTIALQNAVNILNTGVKLRIGPGRCLISSTINFPDTIYGWEINGSTGWPDSSSFGTTIKWTGAADGTMVSIRGNRFFIMNNINFHGNSMAGIGIYARNGLLGEFFANSEFHNVKVVFVTGTPGYGIRLGSGDASPGICCITFDQPDLSYNKVGLYFDNGGGQDILLTNPLISINTIAGIQIHYGSAAGIILHGGSMSGNDTHLYVESGGVQVTDTMFEGERVLNYTNHESALISFINVVHASNTTYDDAVTIAGGTSPIVSINSRWYGNFNIPSNATNGVLMMNNRFYKGWYKQAGGGFSNFHIMDGSGYFDGTDIDKFYKGFSTPGTILSYGSTLGAELTTDGNAEAVGMGSWPNYGSPTSASKNLTTPIDGLQDIHVITTGGAGYNGVKQVLSNVVAGEIYKISFTSRVVSGSLLPVSLVAGVFSKYPTYAAQTVNINQFHEYYLVVDTSGTFEIDFVSSIVSEFYIDDISVKKITAGGLVAGSHGIFSLLRTSPVLTTNLPAAGASNDGSIIIEDAGAGNRNLIIYGGGQRFRIAGGIAF